jgi:hypothetical protein
MHTLPSMSTGSTELCLYSTYILDCFKITLLFRPFLIACHFYRNKIECLFLCSLYVCYWRSKSFTSIPPAGSICFLFILKCPIYIWYINFCHCAQSRIFRIENKPLILQENASNTSI